MSRSTFGLLLMGVFAVTLIALSFSGAPTLVISVVSVVMLLSVASYWAYCYRQQRREETDLSA